MSTPEEREKALAMVIEYVDCQGTPAEPKEEADLLRDTIPVPRAEYDRLRRALWDAMNCNGFPGTPYHYMGDVLTEHGHWTPSAHEFARAMREKGGEGA